MSPSVVVLVDLTFMTLQLLIRTVFDV